MKTELHLKNIDIPEVPSTGEYDYEQIFNMYMEDNYYVYNIIKTIKFPSNLDTDMFDYVRINGKIAWTQISFDIYGTIKLWWLLCTVNKILNPVLLPDPGMIIKAIKPTHISTVLTQIKNQL